MRLADGLGCVVTGGGSGIGRCVCQAFVKRGSMVIVADINAKGGKETVSLITKENGPGKAVFVNCDVTKVEDIRKAIHACKTNFGRFDVMCNNAGVGGEFGSFNDSENVDSGIKNARLVMLINLEAVVIGTQVAMKEMRASSRGGVIINTASMGGIFPMPYNPVYAATKSGVIQFSRSLGYLAQENINVSAICPTYTITPLTALDKEQQERMKQEIGGKMLVPEDVAKGFCVLVEDENSGGKIMRVTAIAGLDYWEPKSVTQKIHSHL